MLRIREEGRVFYGNLFWGRAEMRGGFESEDPFFGGDWGEGLCYIESLTILEWEEIVKHRAVR